MKPLERERCFPDTRVDITDRIESWLRDDSKPNILWLHGVPGVGKSTIAASVADTLRQRGQLMSNFSFVRNETSQRNPTALWRTVAFDLSQRYRALQPTIVKELQDGLIDLNDTTARDVLKQLVLKPITESPEVSKSSLSVVIIDALDESGGLEGSRSRNRAIALRTIELWSNLPQQFKLIVTSRPEHDIQRVLMPISTAIELSVGAQVTEQSSADVRKYIESRFAEIALPHKSVLESSWPGGDVCTELTNRAAGVFIWAKTALDFVGYGQPRKALERLLMKGITRGGVYELYELVLRMALDPGDDDILESFRIITGALIYMKASLRRDDLVAFLGVDALTFSHVCIHLKSVMDYDSNDILRFTHQSFPDFLLNADACPPQFMPTGAVHQRHLVLRCLTMMNEGLHFNLCQLNTSHCRNVDNPTLPDSIAAHIPPMLSYACRFWADHLQCIGIDNSVVTALRELMFERLLFLMEALSLLQDIRAGADAMSILAQWAKVSFSFQWLLECSDSA